MEESFIRKSHDTLRMFAINSTDYSTDLYNSEFLTLIYKELLEFEVKNIVKTEK